MYQESIDFDEVTLEINQNIKVHSDSREQAINDLSIELHVCFKWTLEYILLELVLR